MKSPDIWGLWEEGGKEKVVLPELQKHTAPASGWGENGREGNTNSALTLQDLAGEEY